MPGYSCVAIDLTLSRVSWIAAQSGPIILILVSSPAGGIEALT